MCGLVLLCIFKYLPVNDLLSVMRVCREWARWSIHPSLWPHITLPPNKPVRADQLEGIVRRQPSKLTLNWVIITQEQLKWLITRLPQLSEAEFEGLSWGEVRCLSTCYSPPLVKLNLSFCEGINDDAIKQFLSSPVSRRPGFRNHQASRMKSITHLSLAGAFITDVSIKGLCSELQLIHLDISNCSLLTENTIEIIVNNQTETLESLDIRGCNNLSPHCLPELVKLKLISKLCLGLCDLIPIGAIRVWAQTHGFHIGNDQVLTRIPPSVRNANLAIQSRLVKTTFEEMIKNHIQKVSRNAGFTNMSRAESSEGSPRNDSNSENIEDKTSESIKPSTSRLGRRSSETKNDFDIETVSELTKEKKLLLLLNDDSVDETELNLITSQKKAKSNKDVSKKSSETKNKDDKNKSVDQMTDSNNFLQKSQSEELSPTHSEKSPTRPRRKPSRFADPDVEFSSPTKQPRKKMKQVTVELEDINRSKYPVNKTNENPNKKDVRKPLESLKKRIIIGPKSRCSPRIDDTSIESTKSDATETDVTLSPVGEDTQQSPRRTQRRSREILEEIKDKMLSKDVPILASGKKVKDERKSFDVETKQIQRRKSTIDKELKKEQGSSGLVRKLPKKEKDIMTRSKRLKQDPSKEIDNTSTISTEVKSPRVLICRKEVETSSHKAKNRPEKLLCKIKTTPDGGTKIVKRSRSCSSADSIVIPSKKVVKDKEVEAVYASKLRKKSLEGTVSSESSSIETLTKEEGPDIRVRRRSFRDEEEISTTEEISTEMISETSVARKIATSKDKNDETKTDIMKKSVKNLEKKKSSIHKSEVKKNQSGKVQIVNKESKTEEANKEIDVKRESSAQNKQKDVHDKSAVPTVARKNSKNEKNCKISSETGNNYKSKEIGIAVQAVNSETSSKGLIRRSSSDKLLKKKDTSGILEKNKSLVPKRKDLYFDRSEKSHTKSPKPKTVYDNKSFNPVCDDEIKDIVLCEKKDKTTIATTHKHNTFKHSRSEEQKDNEEKHTEHKKIPQSSTDKSESSYKSIKEKNTKEFGQKSRESSPIVLKICKNSDAISTSLGTSLKDQPEIKQPKSGHSIMSFDDTESKSVSPPSKENALSGDKTLPKEMLKDQKGQIMIIKKKGNKYGDKNYKVEKLNVEGNNLIKTPVLKEDITKSTHKDGQNLQATLRRKSIEKVNFKKSDKEGNDRVKKNTDRTDSPLSSSPKEKNVKDGDKDNNSRVKPTIKKLENEISNTKKEMKATLETEKVQQQKTGESKKSTNKLPEEKKMLQKNHTVQKIKITTSDQSKKEEITTSDSSKKEEITTSDSSKKEENISKKNVKPQSATISDLPKVKTNPNLNDGKQSVKDTEIEKEQKIEIPTKSDEFSKSEPNVVPKMSPKCEINKGKEDNKISENVNEAGKDSDTSHMKEDTDYATNKNNKLIGCTDSKVEIAEVPKKETSSTVSKLVQKESDNTGKTSHLTPSSSSAAQSLVSASKTESLLPIEDENTNKIKDDKIASKESTKIVSLVPSEIDTNTVAAVNTELEKQKEK